MSIKVHYTAIRMLEDEIGILIAYGYSSTPTYEVKLERSGQCFRFEVQAVDGPQKIEPFLASISLGELASMRSVNVVDEAGTHPVDVRFPSETGERRFETWNWNAWIDMQPPNKSTLHVRGKVILEVGVTARLELVPNGESSNRKLHLIIEPLVAAPTAAGRSKETIDVSYFEVLAGASVGTVTIVLPEGNSIDLDVKTVM